MAKQRTAEESWNRKQKLNKIRFWIVAVLIVGLVVWLFVSVYVTKTATWQEIFDSLGLESGADAAVSDGFSGVSVTSIYVGQADCTFIKAGETNILVDAGYWDSYDYIDTFLSESGVTTIDYFFATHPHTDHIGAFVDLLGAYEVGQIITNGFYPDQTPDNSTYEGYLAAIAREGIPVHEAEQGEVFAFDMGEMTVISNGYYSDLNNSSLALHFEYGDTSFLLMGDCEYEAEDDLLAKGLVPPCDVLKAGHHGTKNATSMDFLTAAEPAYVVVSCGIDNEYGYPKDKFMNRVERAGAELYRTDLDGNITFLTDGSNIEIVTDSVRASGQ